MNEVIIFQLVFVQNELIYTGGRSWRTAWFHKCFGILLGYSFSPDDLFALEGFWRLAVFNEA